VNLGIDRRLIAFALAALAAPLAGCYYGEEPAAYPRNAEVAGEPGMERRPSRAEPQEDVDPEMEPGDRGGPPPNVAPPAARAEVAPPARPDHVWVAGRWRWSYRAGQYVWRPGRWVVRGHAEPVAPAAPMIVADAPPPAPMAEAPGVAPARGMFWVPGHWQWSGRNYAWVRGHWENQRGGYTWVAPHWERFGGRWRYVAGHWRRL
jgi:hypothetical protein